MRTDFSMDLFYSEKERHFLIVEFLLNFLNTSKQCYNAEYFIYLSNKRGSSVGINFSIDKTIVKIFLEYSDSITRDFLINYPSNTILQENKQVGIFLDFPNNNVQYNLKKFLPKFTTEQYFNGHNFWQALSDIIILHLLKAASNTSKIFELALHINAIYYFVCKSKLKADYFHSLDFYDINELAILDKYYIANKDSLESLRLMFHESVKDELAFSLHELFSSFIESITNIRFDKHIEESILIDTVISDIHRQLGISFKESNMIKYLSNKICN